ncbi:MAG: PQQ-dependent sugar dehydrogenase [Verrucomicrobiota bacterium]
MLRSLLLTSLGTAALALSAALATGAGLKDFPVWIGCNLEGTGGEPHPYIAVPTDSTITWSEPICTVPIPGDPQSRRLVVERWSNIWLHSPDEDSRTLFHAIPGGDEQKNRQDRAFCLGALFHYDYPNTPRLFISWNRREDGIPITRLSRFEVQPGDIPKILPASEEILFEFEADGHRGGDLKFGHDNYLYMSSGDGASPGDPNNVGQTTDNFLGSIIRIDIDNARGDKSYRIPPDNPFVNTPGIYPEVWAYGFRNPWRMNFHPDTGELWLGDNGDEHWEMVHRIKSGANYGWSAFEGSHVFRASNKLAGPTLEHTLPEVEHSHQEMRSVIGGLWYRGSKFPDLKNWYLYGCHFTRKVWGFPMDGDKPGTPIRIADTGGQIVSFAEDENNEVLVVTLDQGILSLEKAPEQQTLKPIPTLLSETGLFASTKNHEVAEGILPYEINAPAFWNGARRERFMGVSPSEKIQVQLKPPGMNKIDDSELRTKVGVDRWKMPTGSVFFQTFFLGEGQNERRVETQVSLKDRGEWRFLTYKWNDDQTDAVLVAEDGENVTLTIPDSKNTGHTLEHEWRFPSRVECTACHTQRSMFVLGASMAQLNRDFDYRPWGGKKANQIETLHSLGFFFRNFRPNPANTPPSMANPHDKSQPLEERARTYLHVNCAHCHRETGLGGRANFQLLNWLHTADLGLIDERPLVGLPGIDPNQARLIAPGQPHRSEIYRRMATHGVGKMPMLGGTLIDEKGAHLIRQWIKSLDKSTPQN